MRYVLLLVVVGCARADRAQPPTAAQGSAAVRDVAVPDAAAVAPAGADAPRAGYIAKIQWGCFHSNMPWGNGTQRSSVVYDLDAATLTRTNDDTPNAARNDAISIDGTGSSAPPGTHTHTTSAIPAATVAALRAEAARVLTGGPYEEELPPPEGTSCVLELLGAGDEVLLRVAKARQEKSDAANALIRTL